VQGDSSNRTGGAWGDATSFITWAFTRDVTVRLRHMRDRWQETTMETTISRAQDFTISVSEIWRWVAWLHKGQDADGILLEHWSVIPSAQWIF
jgi:hypothetical protein